jgi:hypothetical protein
MVANASGFQAWLAAWTEKYHSGRAIAVMMDQDNSHAVVLDLHPQAYGMVQGQRKPRGVSMATTQEKIAQADERLAKMQKHQAMLRRVAIAESEIPGAYATGQVSMEKLGEQYGISSMTVKRILKDNGVTPKGARRLTDEDVQEIGALILAGHSRGDLAQHYGVSEASVRAAGLKTGAYKKGQRKPHRTDDEYELIKEWDAETRKRFAGAGLLSLGNGLKDWERRRAAKQAADANVAAGLTPEGDVEPLPAEPTNDTPATTEDFEAPETSEAEVSDIKF